MLLGKRTATVARTRSVLTNTGKGALLFEEETTGEFFGQADNNTNKQWHHATRFGRRLVKIEYFIVTKMIDCGAFSFDRGSVVRVCGVLGEEEKMGFDKQIRPILLFIFLTEVIIFRSLVSVYEEMFIFCWLL